VFLHFRPAQNAFAHNIPRTLVGLLPPGLNLRRKNKDKTATGSLLAAIHTPVVMLGLANSGKTTLLYRQKVLYTSMCCVVLCCVVLCCVVLCCVVLCCVVHACVRCVMTGLRSYRAVVNCFRTQMGEVVTTIPTIGLNTEDLSFPRYKAIQL
jgi:hypothetical protein